MRSLIFVAVLATPSIAAASLCTRDEPWFSNRQLPAGCPATYYVYAPDDGGAPQLFAQRAGESIALSAPATSHEALTVQVSYAVYGDACLTHTEIREDPFVAYTLDLTSSMRGDVITANSSFTRTPYDKIEITAAGPCPAPEPREWMPLCNVESLPDHCDGYGEPGDGEPGDGGCTSSTGGVGVLFGLGLASLLRLRRRARL